MQLVISGIPVEVHRKKIKNLHLYVKPPDGRVELSAPESIDDKAIEAYLRANLSFIKKSIAEFKAQPRSSKRQYVSGETLYVWGKQYFLEFTPASKNSFALEGDKAILAMSASSSVAQRESFMREQYRELLKAEVEKTLPKWEAVTGLHAESWHTKYMTTRWGTCNTESRKIWLNLQLAQKPLECLEFVILHELVHLRERSHNEVFVACMDAYMPNWRVVRKTLNDSKLDYYESQSASPLQKLIDAERYDEVSKAVADHVGECSDVTIEGVCHVSQSGDGECIRFDVIVSCDKLIRGSSRVEEVWLATHCAVSAGIELSTFEVISVGQCEVREGLTGSLSGELIPVLSTDDLELEATRFLEKYYPRALTDIIPVPVRKIATEQMGLRVIEDQALSSSLDVFGMIVFEDGNVRGDIGVHVRNAKRGTIYVDPRVFYERTLGTVHNTIAHECYHWFRHRPYHALMRMLGESGVVGRTSRCLIDENKGDRDSWSAVDWIEWQANAVAPKILIPFDPARKLAKQLIESFEAEGCGHLVAIELAVIRLSEFYGVSKQMAKIRMTELGFAEAAGVLEFVDGKYSISHDGSSLKKNQSYSIDEPEFYAGYQRNPQLRSLIDTGAFTFVDGHVCLNDSRYIERSKFGAWLSEYALAHMSECCLVFSKGFMTKLKEASPEDYRFAYKKSANRSVATYEMELGEQGECLLYAMELAEKDTELIRKLPESFCDSLKLIMKNRKVKSVDLAAESMIGSKTLQRLRNDEAYPKTHQLILALCVAMDLSPALCDALLQRAGLGWNRSIPEHNKYRCLIGLSGGMSLFEVNEALRRMDLAPLGNCAEEYE